MACAGAGDGPSRPGARSRESTKNRVKAKKASSNQGSLDRKEAFIHVTSWKEGSYRGLSGDRDGIGANASVRRQ